MTTPERLQYRSLMAANAQPAQARFQPCNLCGKQLTPYRVEQGVAYVGSYHESCGKVVAERRRRAMGEAVNRGGT